MFFERISSGYELALSSWHVLRQNKKLIVFPVLSGMACMLVLLGFAAPFSSASTMAGLPGRQRPRRGSSADLVLRRLVRLLFLQLLRHHVFQRRPHQLRDH